jgi:xanthine/uracil permease
MLKRFILARMDRAPSDRVPLKTLGFAAVFLPGIVMLYAIPNLFPNDDDELGPAQFVFVLMTVATIAGAALMSRRTLQQRRLAVGLIVGYVAWLAFFASWMAAGP